jgi:hypothetical protein
MEDQTTDQASVVRELGLPLLESKGWIKFLGVVSIIQGIIAVFSIVGILIAWLPIWIGVLLYQAASVLERSYQSGDRAAYYQAMAKLRTYFMIQGIMTLIGIVIGAIALALGLMGAIFDLLH